jgi:gamma-glutamyltranspeptidase/glutathione hydrolase
MKKMTPSLTIVRTMMLVFVLVLTGNLMAQPFLKAHQHINPYQYEIVKEKSFDNGAVTSAHPLASMVGAAMMQDGGNAFDAAIATQLSLAVVFPGAGNIGGEVLC